MDLFTGHFLFIMGTRIKERKNDIYYLLADKSRTNLTVTVNNKSKVCIIPKSNP